MLKERLNEPIGARVGERRAEILCNFKIIQSASSSVNGRIYLGTAKRFH